MLTLTLAAASAASAATNNSAPQRLTSALDAATLDYLVQDVCGPANGGPLDPSVFHDPGAPGGCPTGTQRRDLRVGEALPYHKHDRDFASQHIYQLSDAFPMVHRGGEVRVVHSLDFANHGKAVRQLTFLQFDYNVDGFNINQYATQYASIVGTADPSGGVQYFIAANGDKYLRARNDTAAAALPAQQQLGDSAACSTLDAWGLWDKRVFNDPSKASHLFRLNIVRDQNPGSPGFQCPSSYNNAYTTYSIQPSLKFASGKTLANVLVQQHWAGSDAASADSAEKEFFTREYGLTRWEAWEKHSQRQPSKFCDGITHTAGDWTMVDCRDWSYTSADPDGGYMVGRFPTPKHLLSGGNWLDTGDFGRGMGNVGKWSRPAPSSPANVTNWALVAEPNTSNRYLVTSPVDSHGGALVYQDIDVRQGFANVGFGASVWAPSSGPAAKAVLMELLQRNANGDIVCKTTLNLGDPSRDKKQFRTEQPIVLAGSVSSLRFQIFQASGEVALDNCWVGPV